MAVITRDPNDLPEDAKWFARVQNNPACRGGAVNII